jgi:hypothetical protein
MEMDARFHKERAAQIGARRDGQRAAALLRQMVDTRLNGRCGECRAIGPRAEIADRGGFCCEAVASALPPGQTASEASVNPRRDSIVLSGLFLSRIGIVTLPTNFSAFRLLALPITAKVDMQGAPT